MAGTCFVHGLRAMCLALFSEAGNCCLSMIQKNPGNFDQLAASCRCDQAGELGSASPLGAMVGDSGR